MPYEIREQGGKHCVAKQGGDIMKCYPKRDDAIRYMRALYANVTAAAVDFTDGTMIAVFPRPLEQVELAATDGQPPQDLHVTLAFLPEGVDGDETMLTFALAVAGLATEPLEGVVGGVGAFSDNGDGQPIIALPDVVGLAELRQLVMDACEDAGVTVADSHGWTPHLTLGYGAGEYPDPVGKPLHFDAVSLVKGPERIDFPLVGVTDDPTMEDDDEMDAAFDTVTAAAFTAKERRRLADEGVAMEDGSFPIRNASDLENAIRAIGRAKDRAAAVRHIRKRAKALGLEEKVKNLTAASLEQEIGETEEDDDERAATQLCPHCGQTMPSDGMTAAGWDESKHPRAPRGVREGGRFVAVAQGPGSYTVEDTDTGEVIAETRTAQEAVAIQDEANEADFAKEMRDNPISPAEEQRQYQDLVDRARAVGIPTSLDDPASPKTVAELRSVVEAAEASRAMRTKAAVTIGDGPDQYRVAPKPLQLGGDQEIYVANDGSHLVKARMAPDGTVDTARVSLNPVPRAYRPVGDETNDYLINGRPTSFHHVQGVLGDTTPLYALKREGAVEALSVPQMSNLEPPPDAGAGSITASAAGLAPDVPPAEWFDDPQLEGPTPLTVTADGRVFGHVAPWGVCHTGIQGRCVTPPKSRSDYAYFNLGAVQTDKGVVSAGKITMDTGHAPLSASSRVAASHYDHTGVVAADVRAGEDEHGIWIAGAVRPDLDAGQARKLERATVSGDWRRIDGDHEMVGLLAVNVPGFPIPRAQALVASSGEQEFVTALVAAGVMCGCDEDMELERELDELVASSVPAVKLAMAGAPAARK